MELSKIQMCPALTGIEKEMVECRSGQRIDKMPVAEFKKQLMQLIAKVHLESGQVADEKIISLTMPELTKDLLTYFGGLTILELTLAFKHGIMGVGSPYFGLNNKTYLQWCKEYISNPERLEAIKRQNRFLKELAEPKPIEKLESDKNFYNGLKTYISENSKMPFTWDYLAVYRHCERIGEIKMTLDEKKMWAENVKADMNDEAVKEKLSMNRDGYDKIADLMADKLAFADECRKRIAIKHFSK